jgi:hypothetical protein
LHSKTTFYFIPMHIQNMEKVKSFKNKIMRQQKVCESKN